MLLLWGQIIHFHKMHSSYAKCRHCRELSVVHQNMRSDEVRGVKGVIHPNQGESHAMHSQMISSLISILEKSVGSRDD